MKKVLKEKNGITLIALVITIIVLLILAGVSISMLTGDNGILTQATEAKEKNTIGEEKEQISLALQSLRMKKQADNVTDEITASELDEQLKYDGAKNVEVDNVNGYLRVKYGDSKNEYTVDQSGNIESEGEITQPENIAKSWEAVSKLDTTWFSYNDLSSSNKKANVNAPVLKGNMKAIKYVGAEADAQTGSKWANAMTSDGSMFVWIPRYAYKITEGYHTNQAGTIEVAFIDTSNKFLNGETGEITTNVEDPEAGKSKWLVHPAFTSNPEAGGGFGEIPGIWVGKFEATGVYSNGDASKVSVKPGLQSLRNMTINDQYKAGMKATYGESANLNSHMMKNSEWGATVYLAHSKYGTNKQKVEQNTNSSYYTGGTNTIEQIYTTNKKQSTTHNATGVYDLNGGAWERTAAYVNNGNENLGTYGGKVAGDIYGATEEEQKTSTKYKTVYSSENNQSKDYQTAGKKNKGDAVYETSVSHSNGTGSWFDACANFPYGAYPFFLRGGGYNDTIAGSFFFIHTYGYASSDGSFRPVLAP
ncbi:MAG: type II secretion system protein [Clostridia bacterium]